MQGLSRQATGRMDEDSKEVQKEKFIISCYTYSQSYSCTSANQQSVYLNDRHSTVDEY